MMECDKRGLIDYFEVSSSKVLRAKKWTKDRFYCLL